MKKLNLLCAISFLAATILCVADVHAADKDNTKWGYVDLSRIFDEYQKTKDYDKVLEQKSADFDKARNEKVEKIKEAQGKLGLLAEDKKAQLTADIEKMKTELLEWDRQQKQDLTKERNDKVREILLEIEKVVSDYAEKEQFAIILNDKVLIYGNPGMDVTNEIIKRLNPSSASAPAPAAK